MSAESYHLRPPDLFYVLLAHALSHLRAGPGDADAGERDVGPAALCVPLLHRLLRLRHGRPPPLRPPVRVDEESWRRM
eukprot:1772896-Rhodomonas_salina.1